ncbi:MAG TPA: tRNA pseudouridine(38-40) synthase TruA [Acidimicrobiia bacterium]|nr:tRNA pseudouridine(38-40) synthase TruA [Acidimicrobiia bacterium]
MKNFRAIISYNGSKFHGVAEQVTQPGQTPVRTVVGELRAVIEMVAQASPSIVVSGRTDKGVHAREQVISFSFPENLTIDLDRLMHVCNKRLGPEVVVHEIVEAREDFNARYNAKARTYRYFIDNSAQANLFLADYAWNVSAPLDLDAMKSAAKCFVGEQDFSSVCRADDSISHNIREVFSADFIEVDYPEIFSMPALQGQTLQSSSLLCFEISANAFCWQMVRSIVGVLVDVGRGKISPHDITALLENKDRRTNTSQLAPAHGLTLWHVKY